MFRSISFCLCLLAAAGAASAQGRYPGIGRPATPAEIKAWDIDVRADLAGLPKGSGSVKKGEAVWEEKCASCHGTFGDSNEVFTAIVGGTRQADIEKGRTASLLTPEQARTTLMKLAHIATLWDYINRAMPWNAPKTLTVEEVYGVTAFILNLGNIVPDDFVLSEANMAEVGRRLPNRNGLTRAHGLWEVKGKPDVKNTACMKDCPVEGRIVSQLPDHARDAHGNLADQNRVFGPVRGVQTVASPGGSPAASAAMAARSLAEKTGCLACHGIANKLVGPALAEIAAKHKGDGGAEARLIKKVRDGGAGAWGQIPMPAQPQLKDEEIASLVKWVLGGAK
ncbi:MAG: c-type cytochrome [Betaproteobacteria bacterium]|nr:c-type cytochrome [Betaproteobacteria bacterium]